MTDRRLSDEAGVVALLADLDFIDEHWDHLAAARVPGTSRPWRQPLLDPDRRAVMAERDRAERAVRDPDAPGFTSAAMHVDVLDAAVEIWAVVHELTQQVTPMVERFVPGKDRSPLALGLSRLQLRRLDEMPSMIRFVRTWLPLAGPLGADLDVDRQGRALHRLAGEIQRLLSLVRGGQLLAGAVCPWCRGVTPKHPAGGAATLRVEEIAKARPANGQRPAVTALFAVVCWNTSCAPTDAQCGTWWRGFPAWPFEEWEWLADRLVVADPVHVGSLLDPGPISDVVSVVHNGRSGVDRSLCVVPSSSGALAGVRFIDQIEEGSTA
jgi:hypothetical protein